MKSHFGEAYFEEVVQNFELTRVGSASKDHLFAPLPTWLHGGHRSQASSPSWNHTRACLSSRTALAGLSAMHSRLVMSCDHTREHIREDGPLALCGICT